MRSSLRRIAVLICAVLTTALLAAPARATLRDAAFDGPLLPTRSFAGQGSKLPAGFVEDTVFSGLTAPTKVKFAPDGRVFVAQADGLVLVYDSLNDPTASTFADLRSQVAWFGDRGLLGMALDPDFGNGRPYVYVLYTYDGGIGQTAPVWNDTCPDPPGLDVNGCVVSGRLSRLDANGNEQVLIKDEWCQQFSSHSIGDLQFGPGRALYVSSGEGASFIDHDYGQFGIPKNPCGDSPAGVGGSMSPPTAEGGQLRSQDVRTPGDPTGLSGSVIRVDPDTGAPLPDNPGTGDLNARRIVAHGFRNPFRFDLRPGTNDLYVGDVGWFYAEEIDRHPTPTSNVRNFGWPCYEGDGRAAGWDNLDVNICESLYGAGTATSPLWFYTHYEVVAGESCPNNGASISALKFYDGGSFPPAYNGALFFGDYSRGCVWVMFPDANGIPNPATRQPFSETTGYPVDIEVGPDGALYVVDIGGGAIRRIQSINPNQAPLARATADKRSGPAPLLVNFDGAASTDPNGDALSYAWDLDGDGQFDDATAAKPSFNYTTEGPVTVRLRVTDPGGLSGTDQLTIMVGTPPTATISSPSAGSTYAVGDAVAFTGSAVDGQGAALQAAALTWTIEVNHCLAQNPEACHTHLVQTLQGVASGSLAYPDHDYPSHVTLTLKATAPNGLSDTEVVRIDPKTVQLTFQSDPSGIPLTVGGQTQTAPFVRTVMQNGTVGIAAPAQQVVSGTTYDFASWSHGGPASQSFHAPATPTTYTATYQPSPCASTAGLVGAWGFDEASGTTVSDVSGAGNTGTIVGATRSPDGRFGGALSFNGTSDYVNVPDSSSLDLTNAMTLEAWVYPVPGGGSYGWRTAMLKERSGGLAYSLYTTSDRGAPSGHIYNAGERQAHSSTALPLNTWSHLAATFDGTTVRVFVNGVDTGSVAAPPPMETSAGPLRFGGNSVWGEWFAGRLDELRVYNRALSTLEIQSTMTRPVSCASGPPAPALSVSPASLSFSANQGGAEPATKVIDISNSGTGTLDWSAATDQPWLSATPVSGGAPATATVKATLGTLAAGTYSGNVTFTASGANGSPKIVPVTFTVAPPPAPVLAVSPSSLTFSAMQGGADPASQTVSVTNTGGGALSFTQSDDASWLTATPASGAAPQTLTVAPSIAGLSPGTYTGTLTVTATGASGSPKTVTVTLAVVAPPTLAVAPPSVVFTATQGGSDPAAQSVSVTNTGGGSLSFSQTDDATWLAVTPASGSAPAALSLQPAVAGLSAGTYTGTVTVTAPGGNGSPKTVGVTLTVNPPPPPTTGLVGAWGFDETSGSVANDASGKGNTGTLNGPVRTTAGRYGSALTFDGVNDWVTVANSASLNLTSAVTMMAWVYPATVSGYRTAVIKERSGGLAYALYPSNHNSRPSGHVFTTSELQQQGPAALALNTWSHVATTWNGATMALYVNGALVASRAATGTMPTSTGALRFGGNSVWAEWFRGRLDEIRVYDRALTAAQVQSDMNTPIAGTGLRAAAPQAARRPAGKRRAKRNPGADPRFSAPPHRRAR